MRSATTMRLSRDDDCTVFGRGVGSLAVLEDDLALNLVGEQVSECLGRLVQRSAGTDESGQFGMNAVTTSAA